MDRELWGVAHPGRQLPRRALRSRARREGGGACRAAPLPWPAPRLPAPLLPCTLCPPPRAPTWSHRMRCRAASWVTWPEPHLLCSLHCRRRLACRSLGTTAKTGTTKSRMPSRTRTRSTSLKSRAPIGEGLQGVGFGSMSCKLMPGARPLGAPSEAVPMSPSRSSCCPTAAQVCVSCDRPVQGGAAGQV